MLLAKAPVAVTIIIIHAIQPIKATARNGLICFSTLFQRNSAYNLDLSNPSITVYSMLVVPFAVPLCISRFYKYE